MYSLLSVVQSRCDSTTQHHRRNRKTQPLHLTEFHQRVVQQLKKKLKSFDYHISKRSCPSCGTSNVEMNLDGILLDICKRCRGMWFDHDELVHFTDLVDDVPGVDLASRQSRFHCPVCKTQMRECQFRNDSNLLIDRCPEDHGVFIELGEFERALAVADHVDCVDGYLSDERLRIWHQAQAKIGRGEFRESNVSCPQCGLRDVTVAVDDVDIDFCLSCGGWWFDEGELKNFTDDSRDIPGRFLMTLDSSLSCPACDEPMLSYQFDGRSNLMVEGCPNHHGVFLRDHQFPKVMFTSETRPN